VFDESHQPLVVDVIEEAADIGVQYPVHRQVLDTRRERVQRIVLSPSGPEPVREAEEVSLVDGVQNLHQRALDDLVFQRRDAQWPLPPIGIRNEHAARRLCAVRAPVHAAVQIGKPIRQALAVCRPCRPVHARRRFPFEPVICLLQQADVDVMRQGGEPFPFPLFRCFAYARDPR
jgi:hypothetical protein